MNEANTSYLIVLNANERAELFELVKNDPKWKDRIENLAGIISYNLYPYNPWLKKLPEPLHIGKKVKVIRGRHAGREGVVTDHWQDTDDCSSGYGNHLYQLNGDLERYGCKNNSCAIKAEDCEFVQ
jgi:hypothetical protein